MSRDKAASRVMAAAMALRLPGSVLHDNPTAVELHEAVSDYRRTLSEPEPAPEGEGETVETMEMALWASPSGDLQFIRIGSLYDLRDGLPASWCRVGIVRLPIVFTKGRSAP